MTWARLKATTKIGDKSIGADGKQEERLFNLDQLQWWIGRGEKFTELQYASHPPVFVEVGNKRMEVLTGTTGGYADEK